jgi:sporulation protein YlmC with PRC-barrel domain
MNQQEIHLELLIGKQVFALNGRPLGRLEEVRAELNARGHCFVTEFLIGSYAFLERLSAWRMGRAIMRTLHLRRKEGYRVRWEQLDLSDPRRPRLLCEVEELVLLN